MNTKMNAYPCKKLTLLVNNPKVGLHFLTRIAAALFPPKVKRGSTSEVPTEGREGESTRLTLAPLPTAKPPKAAKVTPIISAENASIGP
ncbi:MAG TPA: hypothetical protein VFE53_00930 [Mucilaginibacter sp.]|nr:hypothetical protein [Mucilaginibacter sp.]